MTTFSQLWVWSDQPLSSRLSWYRQVADNERPARALIARRIPARFEPGDQQEVLWQEFQRCQVDFQQLVGRVTEGQPLGPKVEPNLLDLVAELGRSMLTCCDFCRWNCRVDRSGNGKLGACQLAQDSRVSSAFHHQGEELVYRGRHGSGTIFLTSCNMRCSFCQNGDISTDKDNGSILSAVDLAQVARRLRLEGCHNINWVGGDPTIHLHTILAAIACLDDDKLPPPSKSDRLGLKLRSDFFIPYQERPAGAYYQGELNVPQLWNSNFFMTDKAMKLLRVVIDAWLPDFKFGPGRCAIKLARTPWYWETVTDNILKLERWGADYTLRHLIMPNHVECCTRPILEWLKDHAPEAPINMMDQFHPDNYCDQNSPKYQEKYAELNRRCTPDELLRAYRYADRLGLPWRTLTHERRR